MAKLYLCGINDLKKYESITHKFFIARHVKDKEGISRYGFAWLPSMAPLESTFEEFLRLRKRGLWNKQKFDQWYVPLYLQQMYTDDDTRGVLNYVYKLITNGNNVVLACYCHDASMCHRRLIGKEMEKHGIEVVYG